MVWALWGNLNEGHDMKHVPDEYQMIKDLRAGIKDLLVVASNMKQIQSDFFEMINNV